jgi:hypothetical protein
MSATSAGTVNLLVNNKSSTQSFPLLALVTRASRDGRQPDIQQRSSLDQANGLGTSSACLLGWDM